MTRGDFFMEKVIPGRYAARMEGSFVVFIIGMRINRLFAIHKWLPVITAMQKMLKELYQNPELGLLGHEQFVSWKGFSFVQYWRSYDLLEKYARGGTHLKAWKNFNRSVGTDGTVGVYHETYIVQAGQYECIYGNMPKFGLGKVAQLVPAVGNMETARRRIGGNNEPAVPTPPNPEK
jgi:hypothetical protein